MRQLKAVRTLILILSFSFSGYGQATSNSNILFIGKTGAGKSSTINMFTHHMKKESYEQERGFVIPIKNGQQLFTGSTASYNPPPPYNNDSGCSSAS